MAADGAPLTNPSAMQALREHALAAYPEECIGFIDPDGIYHRLRNVCPDPRRGAIAPAADIGEALISGRLRALCHSHPNGPNCPSEQDMRSQLELDVPFIIVSCTATATLPPFAWGDQLLDDAPYTGRAFQHGVQDCYALIRLWYARERNTVLPEFPRGWEWWSDSVAQAHQLERDLYRRHFADASFFEIDRIDMRPGDVWLAAVRSEVPNHAGVYLGDGLALHHASSRLAFDEARLSKREPLARWLPFVTHCLRRE